MGAFVCNTSRRVSGGSAAGPTMPIRFQLHFNVTCEAAADAPVGALRLTKCSGAEE